jgi:hypothetical protein
VNAKKRTEYAALAVLHIVRVSDEFRLCKLPAVSAALRDKNVVEKLKMKTFSPTHHRVVFEATTHRSAGAAVCLRLGIFLHRRAFSARILGAQRAFYEGFRQAANWCRRALWFTVESLAEAVVVLDFLHRRRLSEIQLEVIVDVQEAEVVAAPLQTPKKSLMSVPMKSSSEQSSMFFPELRGTVDRKRREIRLDVEILEEFIVMRSNFHSPFRVLLASAQNCPCNFPSRSPSSKPTRTSRLCSLPLHHSRNFGPLIHSSRSRPSGN